ncbi:ABC transporter substrate-binding protein [Piscinibacter gummiphilus]|uniref:ABC transporter substrate-binding protein n=1 Tax=Piscinibacter gummiphilus TaxID=946333 RepID=A0ABZ0CML0_9BURK|nr:ABC transporter substrate-binding protein [Piscinibacter gummiphilus]WOB06232.1 ABC transporter substrate-binding protein [Piscinibacter gummiphilus]
MPLTTLRRSAALALLAAALVMPALAAPPKDTLVIVSEMGPNGLDTMVPTANDHSRMVAWHVYDRLVSHGQKKLPDGNASYDATVLTPELAERWEISPDKKVYTFFLRKNAKFHDGTPVTAKDVKWSFDRAVAAGGFPAVQMAAGSLDDPKKFSVVDDYTFRITLDKPNKLILPDLVVPVPVIVNSTLAKKHATAADPWALEWVSRNGAGGGAYKIESWTPGQQTVFVRFDDWKSGPLPKLKKVIYRQIASAGTRRALLEKGDVDISVGLPPKDYAELAQSPKVKVIGVPVQNDLIFVDMNTKIKPFDNPKVRQAISYAIPYKEILSSALYNRGVGMFGGDPSKPYAPTWPVPIKYTADLAKAKALLAEAGFPNGFKTTLSFDLSEATVREPTAILIQESLKKIGVEVTLEKVPGSNWFAQMASKTMPMVIAEFYGWLDYPEYFFFWNFDGKNNAVFNTANYTNPVLDEQIEIARFASDDKVYKASLQKMVDIVMTDLPRIPLYTRFSDFAMQKNVQGFEYWFHTHPDFRKFYKE